MQLSSLKRRAGIKILIIVCIFIAFSAYASGAEGDQLWSLNYTGPGANWDIAQGMCIDSNDDIYVAGYGTDLAFSGSGRDIWIKKLDTSGNENTTSWNINVSSAGVGGGDQLWAVDTDSAGNVYVGGSGSGIAGASGTDWWIKKFYPNGTEFTSAMGWDKNFTSPGAYTDIMHDVGVDNDGNIYFVGYGYNLTGNSTDSDWWIKKFYPNGTEFTSAMGWDKNISSAGSYSDYPRSVAFDSQNNVYVAGMARNLRPPLTTGIDWWIKKFYPNGTEYTMAQGWDKNFTSAGSGSDTAQDVVVDNNGNVYVVGYGNWLAGASTSSDWWIKKFYPNGTEFTSAMGWDKNFSSSGNSPDIANSVLIDMNNHIYVAGYGANLAGTTGSDWWIKKFYSDGTEFTSAMGWDKNFSSAGSNTDVAYGIVVDSSNNVYFAGEGNNITGSGSTTYDWWIKAFEGQPLPTATGPGVVLASVLAGAPETYLGFGGNINAQGGNITPTNLTAQSQTNVWQGYYGEVNGNLSLADASGDVMYAWIPATIQGEVFASLSNSVNWMNIASQNDCTAGEGITGTGSDRVNNTFTNNTGPNTIEGVGLSSISANSSCATNTYTSSAASTGDAWEEFILSDGTYDVWATIINSNTAGFDSNTHDFQVIVPANQSVLTYYFYAELE